MWRHVIIPAIAVVLFAFGLRAAVETHFPAEAAASRIAETAKAEEPEEKPENVIEDTEETVFTESESIANIRKGIKDAGAAAGYIYIGDSMGMSPMSLFALSYETEEQPFIIGVKPTNIIYCSGDKYYAIIPADIESSIQLKLHGADDVFYTHDNGEMIVITANDADVDVVITDPDGKETVFQPAIVNGDIRADDKSLIKNLTKHAVDQPDGKRYEITEKLKQLPDVADLLANGDASIDWSRTAPITINYDINCINVVFMQPAEEVPERYFAVSSDMERLFEYSSDNDSWQEITE